MATKMHEKAQTGVNSEGAKERRFLTATNIHPSQADCYARPAQSDCYGGQGGRRGQAANRFIYPVSVSRCEPSAFRLRLACGATRRLPFCPASQTFKIGGLVSRRANY